MGKPHNDGLRVVCSMTTVPSRLVDPKLIDNLKILNNQTRPFDAIYLTVPKVSRRLQKPYPEVPTELHKYCQIVHIDTDYGPITKIVGGLIKESDPNTLIITCDDDIKYTETLVEELLIRHQRYPDSALCFSGIIIGQSPGYISIELAYDNFRNNWWFNLNCDSENGHPIDILFGYSGALYKRFFFPFSFEKIQNNLLSYSLSDNDVYHHDDVMLSAYLSHNNIERRVFHSPFVVDNALMPDALSGNSFFNFKFMSQFFRAINKCKEWGLFTDFVVISMWNTITGPLYILMIIIFVIIMLLLLAWIIYLLVVNRRASNYKSIAAY